MFKTRSYSRNQFRRWRLCLSWIGLSLHDKQLDKVTLKAFRHINKLTIDSIDQLKVPDESIDLLMEIMDYYVDEMTGILFKTKKMNSKSFKNMTKVDTFVFFYKHILTIIETKVRGGFIDGTIFTDK